MTRYCKCDQWSSDAEKLNALKTSFLFCPWCGVRLIAPCWHCGSPSNEKTGNTLYWEDEKNFCSPECVMGDHVKERRN